MQDITRLENDLWEAADQLRANSKLTATEYSLPVLGLIFLRHATNRYLTVKAEIEKTLPSRGGRTRPLTAADFQQKAAIFLPDAAQYEYLVNLSGQEDLGKKINDAMTLIEGQVDFLKGALPKTYTRFENELLNRLLRIFNRDALRKATGDVFGRIYEYFLNKFAMSGAQEGGEFFTPFSLVRLIVNVIEPEQGIVLDPALGSAGMFVQTGHFLEEKGSSPSAAITFYGQEKSDTNVNLARMNMAVHGLEGTHIRQGNTFYERLDHLIGQCHRVMANPPFNVDGVDPDRIKGDGRLFTQKKIPGISSKTKAVSNANYLWIQYFYSYLNATGRAGFVMASSATDAGHGEREIRQQIIETGHVDAIIAIGTNFFYTRSLPCTLWFFDKGKPNGRLDQVLMIDARHIYRVVTRKIRDFSDEQLANITAIVWLHRGQTDRFLALVGRYLSQAQTAVSHLPSSLNQLDQPLTALQTAVSHLASTAQPSDDLTPAALADFQKQVDALAADGRAFRQERETLLNDMQNLEDFAALPSANAAQHAARERLDPFIPRLKALQKSLTALVREASRARDAAEKELNGRTATAWDHKTARTALADLEAARDAATAALKALIYWHTQANWLQSRFPDGVYADVLGLCKVVSRADIAGHDDSLTPGRYVGVAPLELEDDEVFEERMSEIHFEIEALNEEASELASTIKENFEGLAL